MQTAPVCGPEEGMTSPCRGAPPVCDAGCRLSVRANTPTRRLTIEAAYGLIGHAHGPDRPVRRHDGQCSAHRARSVPLYVLFVLVLRCISALCGCGTALRASNAPRLTCRLRNWPALSVSIAQSTGSPPAQGALDGIKQEAGGKDRGNFGPVFPGRTPRDVSGRLITARSEAARASRLGRSWPPREVTA